MTPDRQPTLEGELVQLRPLQENDFAALCAIASDPLLWKQRLASKGDRVDAIGPELIASEFSDHRIVSHPGFDAVLIPWPSGLEKETALAAVVTTIGHGGRFSPTNPAPRRALEGTKAWSPPAAIRRRTSRRTST